MREIEVTKQKRFNLSSSSLFFLSYTLVLVFSFLRNTMFGFYLPSSIYTFVYYLSCMIILIKLLFLDKYTLKKAYLYLGLGLIFASSFYFSKNPELLSIIFLIMGASNIEFKKIVKTYFIVIGSLISLTFILSLIGKVENLFFIKRETTRYAFGTTYPTVFASFLFFLIISYLYLRQNRIKYREIFVIVGIDFFILKYTDARGVAGLILLLCTLLLLIKLFRKFDMKMNPFWSNILAITMVLLLFLAIFLAYNYKPYENFYFQLNQLLSGRLHLGNMGFNMYDIKFSGQPLISNGLGGGWNQTYGTEYFYIDALALDLLLGKGLTIFSLYCVGLYNVIYKSSNKINLFLTVLLITICIYDFTDNKSFRIGFNPFLLMIFSNYFSTKKMEI